MTRGECQVTSGNSRETLDVWNAFLYTLFANGGETDL
jgi:hypothetical protein